ncbi:MAG: D-xylose 1-dehydrogenase Gfo6 [Halanaeroarchaeum sp.]
MDVPLLGDFEYRDWETEADGTIRFALVGMGWWTTDMVLPAIEACDRCTATAVVSGTPEKRERAVAEYDTVETAMDYGEFEEGVDADAYDAVYVCTPNAVHLGSVEAAVERGQDVLVEKPMEATVERARELAAVANEGDATVMVAYRMHTEPSVRYARELVRAGVIGEPQFVQGQMSQTLLELIEDPDQWRLDPDLSGYGTSVMDIGIYPLNTARYLLDADPVSVQSMMRSSAPNFEDVEDEVATFEVAFDDGTLAALAASQNAQETSRLDVVGTEGRLAFDPAFHGVSELRVTTGDATIDVDLPQVDQMEEEFAYFAAKVLADEPVHPDADHGLTDLEAIAAIHAAAARGERVDVGDAA